MNMRLLCAFAAILALSLAEESKNEHLEDLVAEETVELMKESHDLHEAASAYNAYVPPSQRVWNPPQNYVPQQDQSYIQPVNYIPPSPTVPPQNDYIPPQNPGGYYPPHNTWKPPHHTTPAPWPAVIKNEQYLGDDGNYGYEYQLSDGTHVGEHGYYSKPGQNEVDLVKKGWYSFKGADGKVYTVRWWADHSGYHAFGDHIPTPPPVPKPSQVSYDEGSNIGSDNKKPQTYPPYVPQDTFYPTQKPVHYPPQQTYYPPQPTYPTYHQ